MNKILIFSIAYHPIIGGAEIAIKETTDRISPQEIEFDMITLRFDNKSPRFEKIGNVNVHRIGFTKDNPTSSDLLRFPMYLNKIFFPLTASLKAVALHKKRKYNASWAMMSYMGFPALLFLWFRCVPFILTLQEGDSIAHVTRRLRIRLVYPFYKMIFKKSRTVQVISKYLEKFARDVGYKGDISVIPNGVDTSLFARDYSEQELGALRWRFHKEEKDIFLITTSRLVQKNGVADVVRALPLLPENIKFLIIGTGPLEEDLKKLSRDLGVESRVFFNDFWVEYKEIPKYLKISDIFIRVSRSEGMGNSFIEAMSAGIPVIATPVGGIVDFLKENETGVFCQVDNPESVALSVNRILDDTELRKKIVANASRLVAEKYNWEGVVDDMKSAVFAKI